MSSGLGSRAHQRDGGDRLVGIEDLFRDAAENALQGDGRHVLALDRQFADRDLASRLVPASREGE